MGFFSGLTGSKKTTVPASGYYATLPEYQQLYESLLGSANGLYGDIDKAAAAFAPMPLNEGEKSALEKLYAGFTPTAQSLGADISMLTNPYDEFVINKINREATGMNSLVNQQATQAGQQGSNRSFLGTSDVEQNRLNNIGVFRQNQYNTTIDQILNSLTPSRRADAMGALTGGTYEREIDNATRLAPYTALQAGQQSLNGFPTNFGNFGSPETTVKTGGGLGGILGLAGSVASIATGNPMFAIGGNALGGMSNGGGLSGLISGAAQGGFSGFGNLGQNVGSFFSSSPMGPYLPYGVSDERLKEDVVYVGEENGHKVYEFKYIGGSARYRGVIAQEVLQIDPEAVRVRPDGFYEVNYDRIGVEMGVV